MTPEIRIFDDVLTDPAAYRAAALAQPFGDLVAGPLTFHGMAAALDPDPVRARLEAEGVTPSLSFFRQSPHGQREPHFVHTDTDMGKWTAVYYLTPDQQDGDGTSFWCDPVTGAIAGDWTAAMTGWRRWRHVDAVPNRLIVFPAAWYHSRGRVDNVPPGAAPRLVQVLFGKD